MMNQIQNIYNIIAQLNKSLYPIIKKTPTLDSMKQYTPLKCQNLKLKQKSQSTTSITHAQQRNYKLNHTKTIKYLNIQYFKLHPCSNTKQHQHKHCINYHNVKDRKRYGNFYSDNLCDYVNRGDKCPNADACTDAHSRVQQLYQFQTYKKKFCSHYPNNIQKCQYGDYCSFAHSQQQIRTQLIHNYQFDQDFYMFHYKTQFCPFNLTQHDKALCVYSHNLQDYRRNPNFYSYQPIPCYNWKLKDYIYNYELGCQNGVNCNMCHGWKELQYHPNSYKTTKCLETKCRKGQCPNYHSEKERRIIEEDVTSRCFKYVARNRVTQGVFKPETEQSFVPRLQIKVQTVIDTRNCSNITNSDFSPKSQIHLNQSNQNNKIQVQTRNFLGQTLAESDNQSQNNSEIQKQIDKLDLGALTDDK